MAARLAILKAARQLAVEAGVYVHVRKFSVINEVRVFKHQAPCSWRDASWRWQVGAVSIDARLDCDAFASTHSATSHYDRASFVGLAWRPGGESVCCGALICVCSTRLSLPALTSSNSHARAEIYSTGKANLPGSTRQRDLLASFARMVSELLRHSDRPEVRDRLKPHLRLCHLPKEVTRDDAPALSAMAAAAPVAVASRKRSLSTTEGGRSAVGASAPVVTDLFGGDWAMEPLEAIPNVHLDAADTAALLAKASAFLA
jgi:hypothetical protein